MWIMENEETYLLLEPGDEVVTVLLLLQASKGHFGTRDVLRRVMEGQRAAHYWS